MISTDWLLETGLRAAGVLGLTAILVRTVSRSSASLRHLAWAIALGGVIMVPLLSRVLPFRLAVLPAAPIAAVRDDIPPITTPTPNVVIEHDVAKDQDGASAVAAEPALTPLPKRISWASLLPVIWLVGAGALVLRLLAGFWALSTITRRGRSLENTDWTDVLDRTRAWMDVRERPLLLVSERVAMPCTSGWRRPVIILPESALEWEDERREMVLLHELAHIRRGDILWHLIAQVAVAGHWFNPFVWAAARSMRADAERAADDLVVGAGATPSDYAAHLLDIVRGSPARREPASVVPFAQRSEFEGRLLAILETKGVTMPSPRASLLTAALAIAAVLPVAALSAARPSPVLASVDETTTSMTSDSKPAPSKSSSESAVLLVTTLSDPAVKVRLAATEALGGLGDTIAVRALIDVLKRDTDAGVRRAAAWSLGELSDARAIPALSDALRTDTDAEVRRNAAHALGEIEDARATPALSEVLRRDKDVSVRRAIVEALSSIEDPASAAALYPVLKDTDPDMRRAAVEALGSIENVESVDEILPLVRDESKEVRRAAVDALGSLEDKRALPALARALGDTDVEVRRAAADAIGSLDEVHSAPPELIRALRDEDPEVRRNAVNALSSIDDPAGVAPLAALIKDQDVEIRRAAVEALEDIEDANATRALREALRDEDPEVRRIAAKALGNRSR